MFTVCNCMVVYSFSGSPTLLIFSKRKNLGSVYDICTPTCWNTDDFVTATSVCQKPNISFGPAFYTGEFCLSHGLCWSPWWLWLSPGPVIIVTCDCPLLQLFGLGKVHRTPRLMNSLAELQLISLSDFLMSLHLDWRVSVCGRCLPYNLICFWVKRPYWSVPKERDSNRRLWECGSGCSCSTVQLPLSLNFTLVSFFMRLPLRWSLRSWSHGLDCMHSLEYVLQPKMLWPKRCQIQSFFNPFSVSHYIYDGPHAEKCMFSLAFKHWLFWLPLPLTSPSVLAFLFVLWSKHLMVFFWVLFLCSCFSLCSCLLPWYQLSSLWRLLLNILHTHMHTTFIVLTSKFHCFSYLIWNVTDQNRILNPSLQMSSYSYWIILKLIL